MGARAERRARRGYALFESPIGLCGIAWGERGIVRVQLPDATRAATVLRLTEGRALAEERPPAGIARAIERIVRHLRGDAQDLADLPLDLGEVAPFRRRVYEAARAVPAGETATYGELARRLAAPAAARAIGRALGVNPFPIVVPCHRIVAASGKMGGFSAHGGVATKERLLAIEGVAPPPRPPRAPAPRNGALGYDVREAIRHLRHADVRLGAVIDRVGPCAIELRRTDSAFAALAEAIVYQQLHGKAAATILARFKALYPGARFPGPEQVLATPEEALRRAGLSRNKMLAILDLAEKARSGVVPSLAALRRMANEDVIARLTAVRGIGRWTAEMLLIFRLGRPDVLPVDDYGVRKGWAVALKKRTLPSPAELARYGERWKPYRTVASWYLWRAADMDRLPLA